jgi:hypothetical protein
LNVAANASAVADAETSRPTNVERQASVSHRSPLLVEDGQEPLEQVDAALPTGEEFLV